MEPVESGTAPATDQAALLLCLEQLRDQQARMQAKIESMTRQLEEVRNRDK
jgi:hypothetical protein